MQKKEVMVGLGVTFPAKLPKNLQAQLWILWHVGMRNRSENSKIIEDLSKKQLYDLIPYPLSHSEVPNNLG